MFTKCPSCRTEISFEPPSNAPAGYKHRIKCPNPACGVTISVALPSKQAAAPVTATGAPIAAPATTPEASVPQDAALEATKSSGKVKYKGRARSFMMLLFSLIFVALNVVSYLISTGKMSGIAAIGLVASGTSFVPFNGIPLFIAIIKDFATVKALFVGDFMVFNLIVFVLPAALLLFAGILTLSNLIGFIAGKYGKTGNVIFSLFTFIFAAGIMFQGFIVAILMKAPIDFAAYFQNLLNNSLISIIAAGVGLLFFIFAIIFAAKKKKAKEPKIA